MGWFLQCLFYSTKWKSFNHPLFSKKLWTQFLSVFTLIISWMKNPYEVSKLQFYLLLQQLIKTLSNTVQFSSAQFTHGTGASKSSVPGLQIVLSPGKGYCRDPVKVHLGWRLMEGRKKGEWLLDSVTTRTTVPGCSRTLYRRPHLGYPLKIGNGGISLY